MGAGISLSLSLLVQFFFGQFECSLVQLIKAWWTLLRALDENTRSTGSLTMKGDAGAVLCVVFLQFRTIPRMLFQSFEVYSAIKQKN